MDGEDLSEYAVEVALEQGARYAEARFVDEDNEGYSTRNGEILSAGRSERKGIGIRVLTKGSFGFCSLDELSRGSVEDSLSATLKMAKAARRRVPIELSEEQVFEDSWRTKVEIPFAEVDREAKVDFLLGLDRAVEDLPGEVPLRTFFLKLSRWRKHLVTSEGARIDSECSLFSLNVMFQAQADGQSEQRHFGIGGTGGWEWVEKGEIESKVSGDARRTIEVAAKARSMDLGRTDVVIGPEVAGIVAHENCGHPSEGDRIMGREAAQAGESWYVDLEVGESRIGSPQVTIIDDPTIAGSAGFYLYDDEAVKARPRYLIKEGILNELLLNREFAARCSMNSTAAARAIGYDREPIIRMANTYFAPGDHSEEELIEGIDRGLFMRNFTEWNIDDRRYQSKYVGSEAILIEKGELTDVLVRRPVLELTTTGLFSSIDACAKGFEADLASCGKSDPMQGAPVWTAGPAAVRLRGIRVGVGI
jgi:TldD protein